MRFNVNIQRRERAELKVEIEISPCNCAAPRKRQNMEIMQHYNRHNKNYAVRGGIPGISISTPHQIITAEWCAPPGI